MANQVDVLNAMLGVVPDHSNDFKSVFARDASSGEELRLSVKESSFTAPRLLSQKPVANGVQMDMSFPSLQAMNQWLAEQKVNGLSVTPLQKPQAHPYYLGAVHHQRRFGGPCGLGAVAYVTQTFLAQEFPDLTRSGDSAQFIAYTQAIARLSKITGGCSEAKDGPPDPRLEPARQAYEASLAPWGGEAPVWWDFGPQPDATPNAFEFGHRVVVGVDAADGQIFGRFSLFSSIHFGMRFGAASAGAVTKTVTVDIDPMAAHPPNDIKKVESATAIARVAVPEQPTASLAAAISSTSQESVLSDLLRKIEAHSLGKAASKVHAELAGYSALSEFEAEDLLARVIDGQAQRVLNVAKYVLKNFKPHLPAALLPILGPMIDAMTIHDPNSANGLSTKATETLELAKGALASQMREDIKAGRLDERRIAELLGEGPGAAVIGQAVLAPMVQTLSQ
ncbi:hypothetical protein [Delftia sp. WSY_7]|uniref:hypothetical protein n=1 Tax=Delftia sp. WSY_7 TaxID=3367202 RepID=UPI00370DA0CD